MISIESALKKFNISTNRKVVATTYGNYVSNQKGYGLDFNQLREYEDGDNIKRIDWSATARSRKVQVREYIENKNITVNFVVDCSSSMLYPAYSGESKLDIATIIITGISSIALKNGDQIGSLVCGKNNTFLRPTKKEVIVNQIRNAISQTFNEQAVGVHNSVESIFTDYRKYQKKQSVCFFITDNTLLDQEDIEALVAARSDHDIFVINIPHYVTDEKFSFDGDVIDLESLSNIQKGKLNLKNLNDYINIAKQNFEGLSLLYTNIASTEDVVYNLIELLKRAEKRKVYRKFS